MSAVFQAGRRAARDAVAARLEAALDDMPASTVVSAMRHALVGGKGLRGFLVMESARLHGIAPDVAVHPAAGVEAMHAYSLVHDDLPAMDDDAVRRGRPTAHVQWDEPTAILAGDALQALAFELATDPAVPNAVVLARTLGRAAGAAGMVYGQALDIAAETAGRPLTLPEIETLQAGKTGALFGWAAAAGPRMAGADTGPLERYAAAVGLAFQIADDLLDVEGDPRALGKRTGKDAAANKATFVSLLGADEARRRAAELAETAVDALACYGKDAVALHDLAQFTVDRDR